MLSKIVSFNRQLIISIVIRIDRLMRNHITLRTSVGAKTTFKSQFHDPGSKKIEVSQHVKMSWLV